VLTVFIATHNGAATLPRVLDAYTRLQPPAGGWKLVVIDSASSDDSAHIAQSFAERLPLLCMSEPTRGKNRALNTGLPALDGDLGVFSDDDSVPDADWLVQLRTAANRLPDYAVFGGAISPIWSVEPEDWILQWVRWAPVFSVTDAAWNEGPCAPTRVWGANMAVRAEPLRSGYRFDERLGPDGSATYAMGGETEFTLRLAIAGNLKCWHCKEARVRHIITPKKMTRAWVLQRAFHLGRCVYREALQKAAAGQPYVRRDPLTISKLLAREVVNLTAAHASADARRLFEAGWQVNLCLGCLFEAANSCNPPPRRLDAGAQD
jgi:glycosyltransferase involved in cell wall biosynthesis